LTSTKGTEQAKVDDNLKEMKEEMTAKLEAMININKERTEANHEKMDAKIDANQDKKKVRIEANNEKFEVLSSPGWITTKPGQCPLKKK
jgi:hypothetical protein